MIAYKALFGKHLPLFCIVLMIFGLAACSWPDRTIGAQSEIVMDTVCHIDLFESGTAELYRDLFTRLRELEHVLSAYREDSELAKLNRNAGLEAVEISMELYAVLERALYFAEISGGAFDPTVGPLVKLWDINSSHPRVPLDNEIQAILALVNWQDLELTAPRDGYAARAFLKRQGMAVDLGAIAKGFAADQLVKILEEQGVPRAIINLGGDIYVWGERAGGGPWRIAVQDPLAEQGIFAGILYLGGDISVVCSGVYERYFTGADGKSYHHILGLMENGIDSRRGYPVENHLLSVTVIAASAMDADALSTACFVLGYEKGLELAMAFGAEILFIFEDKAIRGSPGALDVFSPSGVY